MTPDAIRNLPDGELQGWWRCVMIDRIQHERDGERAALIARAKALGVELPQK
ncbi:MAG: hypothetical protein GOVbin7368_63 [Prokaryotic dsDNA virus sp.]|nr:MAG: hypothetical protein GOVbin7368_63 [Prokaryotic dsDNA virus sp.]|tara:strand:+ start:5616 stop:5771 length:156 start_codon:yes stop_codon:yes gene_type:complete